MPVRSGNVSPFKAANSSSPVHVNKFDSAMFSNSNSNNPIGINSVSSSNSNIKHIEQNTLSPKQPDVEDVVNGFWFYGKFLFYAKIFDLFVQSLVISKDMTPSQLVQWINQHRLGQHMATFAHFSGADLLRMSKDDIIQICGVADGIRMYNTVHLK